MLKPYDKRFIKEYQELSERINKLENMIESVLDGSLVIDLDSSISTLTAQLSAMNTYLCILDMRIVDVRKKRGIDLYKYINKEVNDNE